MIQYTLALVFWILILAVAGLAVWRAYSAKGPLVSSWRLTAIAATFSLMLILLALRIGYVAPVSILQDIVCAQEALRGHRLPTTDLQPYIQPALDSEPISLSLDAIWPALLKEEQDESIRIPGSLAEQAHPPFMTLFMIPWVYFLEVRHTFVAMYFLSLCMIGVAYLLLHRGLQSELAPNQTILAIALILGCSPMFWILRSGQSGALICGLIVIAWYCIRTGRPVGGGCAIAFATSIKLFPGLLLVYLLLRHRKAFISGIAAMLVFNLLAVGFLGWRSFADYAQTVGLVATQHGRSPMNSSLLGVLHRIAETGGVSWPTAKPVLMGFSLLVVAALSAIVWIGKRQHFTDLVYDREFSLFVAAMPLLSPITWFHYYVVLLLPLAVLSEAIFRHRARMGAVIGLFAILAALSSPPYLFMALLPWVQSVSWNLGQLLKLLQPLAMMALLAWMARLSVAAAKS